MRESAIPGAGPMTDAQFRRHMAEFGADPARWPPDLRAGAERALAASPALRAARAEAVEFDRLLAGVPPDIGAERIARLLTAVGDAARSLPQETLPQETLMVLLLGRMPRRTAAGLCLALLALGWLAGSLAMPTGLPRGRDVALLSDDVTTLFDGDSR